MAGWLNAQALIQAKAARCTGVTSLMESKGISNFQEYIKLLEADSDAFDEFFKRLTINVSDFFRNPERFEDLKRSILPRLLAERKHLKVWSEAALTAQNRTAWPCSLRTGSRFFYSARDYRHRHRF